MILKNLEETQQNQTFLDSTITKSSCTDRHSEDLFLFLFFWPCAFFIGWAVLGCGLAHMVVVKGIVGGVSFWREKTTLASFHLTRRKVATQLVCSFTRVHVLNRRSRKAVDLWMHREAPGTEKKTFAFRWSSDYKEQGD